MIAVRRVAVLACAVLLAACSSGAGTPPGAPSSSAVASASDVSAPVPETTISGTTTWTGAEQRYGGSFKADPGVRYQPDVVLVARGAAAVHSVDDTGLWWTLDGADPDVRRLRVGSVLAATSFAVGRVARIEDAGTDRKVLLTPVELTEVVRDARITTPVPVPLTAPLYYSAPGLTPTAADLATSDATPSAQPTATATPSGAADVLQQRTIHGERASRGGARASLTVAGPLATGTLPQPSDTAPVYEIGNYKARPICCDGLGVQFAYHSPVVNLQGSAKLVLKAPALDFRLAVSGGRISEARLALEGGARVQVALSAARIGKGETIPVSEIPVPGTLSFPLPAPIPLSATLTNAFTVAFGLNGASTVDTSGELTVSGKLGFGYTGGSSSAMFGTAGESRSFVDRTTITAYAPSFLVVGWKARITVGLGLIGFTVGPYLALNTRVGVLGQGPVQSLIPCKDAAYSIIAQYGIGYSMPRFFAKVLNSVLSLFNAKPVPAEGGIGPPPVTLTQDRGSGRCTLPVP